MHVCIQPQARYRVEEDATAIAPRKTCAAHDGRLVPFLIGGRSSATRAPRRSAASHDERRLSQGASGEHRKCLASQL